MSASASPSRRDPGAPRRSGQTIAQFCAAECVSVPSFYLWKRTLAGRGGSVPPVAPAPSPTLVPIRLTPAPAPAIELAFPSGAIVRFPSGTCPETIVAVLRGMEVRPC